MSAFSNRREIRVRPVVRYLVTDYHRGSSIIGEFPTAVAANLVASAVAYQARVSQQDPPLIDLELSRQLRIDAIRGPDGPRPALRYELSEAM